MKKILVFLVILFSFVFIWSLVDEDIPVIPIKSEVKEIIEINPFQSNGSSGYEVALQAPKDERVLPVKIAAHEKNKPRDAHFNPNSCDRDCLEQIKQKFFNNLQNQDVTNAILQKLISVYSPESLEFLSEVIVLANDTNNEDLLNDINANIRAIKSKEVVISLIESLLNNKDSSYAYSSFPISTKQAMTEVINDSKDREHIIPVLEHVYFSDKNLIEKFLSGLDYPEMYSLIAVKAWDTGDLSIKETAIENLINNSSVYSVPAIYLYAEKNHSSTVVEDTFYLAKEWGTRHTNPKSIDMAEAYLHGGQTSTAARIASVGILSSMDDKEKLSSILTKVRQHSEDSVVDAYIDETLLKLAESEIQDSLDR